VYVSFVVLAMALSYEELDDQVEMLPTHTLRRPSGQFQSVRFVRRCAARYGTPLLLGITGIAIVGYFFWHVPSPPPRPPIPINFEIHPPSYDLIWTKRSASVKEAFLHAYSGYEKYTTFPDDELRPISNSGQRK